MTIPASPSFYPGQFATLPDLLHVALSQTEIAKMMLACGEHEALSNLCLSIAVVADAISHAQSTVYDDNDQD